MAQISSSAAAVQYSRIRELAEIAMGMPEVYRLYFGESNLPTPEFIKNAAIQALHDGFTYYTSNAGLPELRADLAAYYARVHGVPLEAGKRIVVTTSGVQALNVGIRCVLNPGDEALILTPAWPNGTSIVQMCNAIPRQIAQPLSNGRYGIDFQRLERAVTPKTRLLLYTSPSNPLGWVATVEEQKQLLEFARRHQLWIMADEVYERLYYVGEPGGPVPSLLRLAQPDDAVIVVQSFSKSYCMTGWRVGWLVSRADLAGRATELNEFIISHAPSFAQRAAQTALRDGEPFIKEQAAKLKENRDYCMSVLRTIPGVTVPQPDGAFYLFPKVDGLTDSFNFCKEMLLATHVGIAPGVAFGEGGEGSVRICYAADRSVLEPAMERLRLFFTGAGARLLQGVTV
ncbi:MAG: pyridoxal phosphate-dependent aminotransferase [Bryobacterales bacterium]|nr:pyridoxal phosphate-dependent aminotransferase [Bryobacterales bacterium]